MIATEVKYKKTGFDWMPEVPENWELKKLKYCASQSDNESNIENIQFKIALENIESWTGNFLITESEGFEGQGKIFRKGDVLFNKLRPYLAKVFLAKSDGVCVSEFLVLKPNHTILLQNYLFYRLLSKPFIDIVNSSTYGAKMPRANWDFIGNLKIALPPLSEQDKIVHYIKAQEEKINLFIQKKKRFIELLKEQRLSIINDKLQINAKRMRLKYCVTKVGSGVTPRGGAEVYLDEGIIFLRSQNVHNDGLRLDNVSYISEEINSEMKGSEVHFNDVLINVTGASIGRCYVYDIDAPANVNQHVCIMRPMQEIISSEFLMLQLQSERIQAIINMVEGASREGLTNKDIKNFQLFVPTIEEQKQIVSHIKTETAAIDTALAKAEREIELIREYKEAMVSEAVMGKKN